MAAAFSASADGWEAKSPSGVGCGFSGGVSLKSSIHWHPAFCGTLPARACPAASKSLMVCVSRNFLLPANWQSAAAATAPIRETCPT
jgi:hypothetical protein